MPWYKLCIRSIENTRAVDDSTVVEEKENGSECTYSDEFEVREAEKKIFF